MTKNELTDDIFFRIQTIMDLNGLNSVGIDDVPTICEAYRKGTSLTVDDVLEEAEHFWQYLQNNMVTEYDVIMGNATQEEYEASFQEA